MIADWAVERMIDKQKFHNSASAFLRQRRVGPDSHSFGYILRTGNLRARHPVNGGLAIGAEFRFPIRAYLRHAHFDQTHPTIAWRTELRVITVPWNVGADLGTGFDQARALWEPMPDPVDLNVKERRR